MSSRVSSMVMGLVVVAVFALLVGPLVTAAYAVPPDPVVEVRDWVTSAASQSVRFHLRWRNQDPLQWSAPVTGQMSSQEFGVFLQDSGAIGSFDVPPIPPSSFFDVFFDVALSQLPPSAPEMLPGGGPANALAAVADSPPCPPDDHWDGNVDVVWTGAGGTVGTVDAHYGTLQVCPGAGNSYIHVKSLLCSAAGTTWSVTGLCPGFFATLVKENFSPAPAILPAGWTGWICVRADASVPAGSVCCPKVEFVCDGVPAEVVLCTEACQWATVPNPVPQVLDWVTDATAQTVRFQVRWHNPDPQQASAPVSGSMSSQEFGVFLPDFGPIGSFNVPPLAPDSFFDVFFDVSLSQLPTSAAEQLPGGGPGNALAGVADDPPCPPDDHWDGNVDVVWTGAGGTGGTVDTHYGTLRVCPGGGNSYIHVKSLVCSVAGTSWSVAGLCAGYSATLVNEDYSPAPAVLPAGWTGWICVRADASVAVGAVCCLTVQFDCDGVPAEVVLCAEACQWAVTPNPVPEVKDWVTDAAAGTVRFHVQWHNTDLQQSSPPVLGSMSSQKFGVFLPDFGPIGSFNVPPLAPDSFFDVFFDVALSSLPPSALEQTPAGGSGNVVTATASTLCPPDDHWDGNVDIVWTGGTAGGGQVNAHYGTLQVCPGAGNSYIHVAALICSAAGTSWSVTGLCPGYTATLVNEDSTAAPAVLPAGWTGWICVHADASVTPGSVCCLKVQFVCDGSPAEVVLCAEACDWAATPNPVPEVKDWVTLAAAGTVRFQVRWHNTDSQLFSPPVSGSLSSQEFGVFLPDFGPIGSFNVPQLAPDSFFDVFFDVALSQLPTSAAEQLPGGGPGNALTGLADASPCLPDDHWDGNVDIVWTGGSAGGGQVNAHYGTLQVCPGAGNSYIHVAALICSAAGTSWSVTGLCPGYTATLVNEDYSPAPAVLPAGWTGWICVRADASVTVGTVCCLHAVFDCDGVPAEVVLCAEACQWATAPDPVPQVLDWATNALAGTVRFQVRWHNPDSQQSSAPVSGSMSSQEFGVFLPDFGPIGSFNVPPLAPDSFFDVFFDVALADLPASALEQFAGGGPGNALTGVADGPPCPPDDHWDGNVDVVWSGASGTVGQVNAHYGTLQVCPGAGNSYIHVAALICSAAGTSWTVTGLCPGYTATLVNEDYSPAPAVLPPTWTGWICVRANASVAVGTVCCLTVNFVCDGVPAEVVLCAEACQWATAPNPVPQVLDWVTDAAAGTVRFQVRWRNPDPQVASAPATGTMSSQEFGVFMPDFGPIGNFDVPSLPPDSFFDVFFDVSLSALPPSATEQMPGSGQFPCPPDFHWDGNVDVSWTAGGSTGNVNVHYGTLWVCPGTAPSYIHVRDVLCNSPVGAGWAFADVCPGYYATLVNEDKSPAPAALPPGWSGWICVRADGTVAPGTECCLRVLFDCDGVPAEARVCVKACDCGRSDVPVTLGAGLALRAAPNPTTASTTLYYSVPAATVVRLEIFDTTGKLIRTLLSSPVEPGTNAVTWDGRAEHGESVPSGVYLARLTAGDAVVRQKVLVTR